MPGELPVLSVPEAHALVERRCLSAATPGRGRVGLEAEWLVVGERPDDPVPPEVTRAALSGVSVLPDGSVASFEPGGQFELSTPAARDAPSACRVLSRDAAAAAGLLARDHLRLCALGLDPYRPARRYLGDPRYSAMEAYFDGSGPAGRTMMCSTASLQVNLDLDGGTGGLGRRWALVHRLGPVLLGMFANSPLAHGGRPTGWMSTRMATWLAIDRSRTAPVSDPARWADFALDALVMLVRRTPACFVRPQRPLSFRSWLEDGCELGYPDVADLEYHLTTLFPPVRARGWLELRFLDALPEPWCTVAVAAVAALVDTAAAGEAERVAAPAAGLWAEAARGGLRHPALAVAARRCTDLALAALPDAGADAAVVAAAEEFRERYVHRRRTPAHDVLAALPAEEPSWT